MNKRLASPRTQRLFLLAFALILVSSLVYSRGIRRFALGDEFQYIPRESVLVVATGDIASLWGGLEAHLGTALRATSAEGKSPLSWLKKTLEKEEVQIPRLADVSKWGLDVHRGILLSAYRVTQNTDQVLLVLPITDSKQLLLRLERQFDQKPQRTFSWKDREGRSYTVYQFEGFFLSIPEAGTCVVSTSAELLQRSLLLRRENLSHATGNDGLYQAVRRRLGGPLANGPNVFAYWQSRTAPFGERTGVLRLSPSELRLESDISLANAPVRVFDSLRRHNASPLDWPKKLPPGTLAAVMAEDRHLDLYRNFLAEHVFRRSLEIPDVTRLVFAVTNFEDGLPDILIGLWGNRRQLEKAAKSAQRGLRQTRDLLLLNGALEKYGQKGRPRPSLADLERLRLLEPETNSLFNRYPFLPHGIGTPEFRSQDFSSQAYERTLNGHRISFLAPPLTENDLRYRTDLEGIDRTDLQSDRYRMACLFLQDSLWIATDVRDLERLTLSAPDAGPGLETNAAFQAASAEWHAGAKFQAFVGLDRIISLGLLVPGSDLDGLIQGGLADLRGYSTFGMEAVPSSDQQRLVVEARFRRGAPR